MVKLTNMIIAFLRLKGEAGGQIDMPAGRALFILRGEK